MSEPGDHLAPRCYYSPDYAGNDYQRILYSHSERRGWRFTPVDAPSVPERLLGGSNSGGPRLFHQHWLKEIFRDRADAAGRAWIESYFDSLRQFQEQGGTVVWTVHNLLEHDQSDAERELNLHCLRRMAGVADLVHVHTRATFEEFRRLTGEDLPENTTLLKHPLYDRYQSFPSVLPVEVRYLSLMEGLKFLAFGMHRPYKGSGDLLAEFISLTERDALGDSCLIIAGRISDPAVHELWATAERFPHRIRIINKRLSNLELASLCEFADVGVLPYRSVHVSGSYYQAASFGLPCIVPDIGMFPEEVKDGETGLTYSSGEGLGSALLRAFSTGRAGLRRMGEAVSADCAGQSEERTGRRFYDLLLAELTRSAEKASLPMESGSGRVGEPDDAVLLSFCIPVMGRFDDLKATLARNLADNAASRGRVEFIVVCFDRDTAVENWIQMEFSSELSEGYLRFYRFDTLDFWHFGRAKNAFKSLMKGRIYSSLDGDNYTGYRGGEHIIEVFEDCNYNCVFHQFQGEWGDGTCGRVSLTREDYIDFGYDESFLPRQWDELDAMLTVLAQRHDRALICYRGKSIIDKSQPMRRFLEDHGLAPRIVQLPPEMDPLSSALVPRSYGTHDNNYIQDNLVLRYSSVFNHLQSFFKNSDDDEKKIEYVRELVDVQRKLLDSCDPVSLERWVLRPRREKGPQLTSTDIPVLACVKNELDLEGWYDHYKALGASCFLLIDDGSDVPVEETLPHDDVHVWRPVVGRFRYAKVFWIEILLARYCRDLWCLTVDADEFISLPAYRDSGEPHRSTLRRSVDVADKAGKDHFCGFLLDTVPGSEGGSEGRDSRESFRRYQYHTGTAGPGYTGHNTVSWSYGRYSAWAHCIDVRYRINNSLDSLRKFPLIRYRRGMHLNQGFHDLFIDGVARSPADLARPDLVPILHYKLWAMAHKRGSDFDMYHHETSENLKALAAGLEQKIDASAKLDALYPYLGYSLIPTPSRQRIALHLQAEGVDESDEAALLRHRDFVFRERLGSIALEGNTIYGPDRASVVRWLRTETPFGDVLERSDAVIHLCTGNREISTLIEGYNHFRHRETCLEAPIREVVPSG